MAEEEAVTGGGLTVDGEAGGLAGGLTGGLAGGDDGDATGTQSLSVLNCR